MSLKPRPPRPRPQPSPDDWTEIQEWDQPRLRSFLESHGFTWHDHDKGRVQITESLTNEVVEFADWTKVRDHVLSSTADHQARRLRAQFKVIV